MQHPPAPEGEDALRHRVEELEKQLKKMQTPSGE
jgi:hypothetical protein